MSDFHISNILHPHVSHQNLFKCGYLSRRAWWREIWQLRGHVVACVDGSCLLIQGAVLKSNRSPWIARPRAHPARTYDSGGDTTAGLDIQLQHPGLIWSDRPLVLDLGESMNEVIHQPPDGTRCVRGIVWRNLDTGLPQSASHLSVSSSWRKNVLELIFSPSAFRAEATVDDREVTFSAFFQALCGLHSRGDRWNAHFTFVCGPGLQAVLRRDKYNQTTFNMNEDKWRN